MSNRSYLYACDADPTVYTVAPRGVCEHVADVGLLQLIMVARGARIVASQLFDDRAAVIAHSTGAAERALAFADRLGQRDIAEPEDFLAAVDQMRDVLANTALGSCLLLEVAEVFDTDESVDELVGTLADLDAQVERALRGEENAWLDGLAQAWQDTVMPWWSNTLCYAFEAPFEWTRSEVEAQLLPHDRTMSARVGHSFRFRLAPALNGHQLRSIVGVLTSLVADVVESGADPRLFSCEISAHEHKQVAVSFRDSTLFITVPPSRWPSQGPKRRVMEALGTAPPPARYEYGRGTV
jgi:hypothetical protein